MSNPCQLVDKSPFYVISEIKAGRSDANANFECLDLVGTTREPCMCTDLRVRSRRSAVSHAILIFILDVLV